MALPVGNVGAQEERLTERDGEVHGWNEVDEHRDETRVVALVVDALHEPGRDRSQSKEYLVQVLARKTTNHVTIFHPF